MHHLNPRLFHHISKNFFDPLARPSCSLLSGYTFTLRKDASIKHSRLVSGVQILESERHVRKSFYGLPALKRINEPEHEVNALINLLNKWHRICQVPNKIVRSVSFVR